MVEPAIQLYTLRNLDEPVESTLERVAQTNYGGVEFAGLGGASAEDVASKLAETDLDAVGAHVGIERLEQEYESVVETYDALDCSRLVIPSYDPGAFTTEQGVDDAAARISEVAARLDRDGFELLYHNHTFEFEPLGDGTALDRFVEQTDDRVGLETDTGLAKRAGVDPVELLRRYSDRISLVHLTDTRSGPENTQHVELGGGEVELQACIEAVRSIDVDWIIYEHGYTTDPAASLTYSDSALTAMIRT